MTNVFITVLNMGIAASWTALAVVLVRLLLRRAPAWIRCAAWVLVAVRLVIPVLPHSPLSLIPSAETVPQEITEVQTPEIDSGFTVINSAVNLVLEEKMSPRAEESANPMQTLGGICTAVWLGGIALMLAYAGISYCRVRLRIRERVKTEKGVYVCDAADTPFILGVVRPMIIIPSSTAEDDRLYVLAHERAHLRRLDHLWKPLGYLLLTVYWFLPPLWLAYALLCRDIEAACDEKVIASFGEEAKKPYSDALLNCSAPRRMITVCPLAFGETGVKGRIKKVLNFKKPTPWIIIAALLAVSVVAVCFLTSPSVADRNTEPAYDEQGRLDITPEEMRGSGVSVYKNADTDNPEKCRSVVVIDGEEYPIGNLGGEWGVMSTAALSREDGGYDLVYTYNRGSGMHHSDVIVFDTKTGTETQVYGLRNLPDALRQENAYGMETLLVKSGSRGCEVIVAEGECDLGFNDPVRNAGVFGGKVAGTVGYAEGMPAFTPNPEYGIAFPVTDDSGSETDVEIVPGENVVIDVDVTEISEGEPRMYTDITPEEMRGGNFALYKKSGKGTLSDLFAVVDGENFELIGAEGGSELLSVAPLTRPDGGYDLVYSYTCGLGSRNSSVSVFDTKTKTKTKVLSGKDDLNVTGEIYVNGAGETCEVITPGSDYSAISFTDLYTVEIIKSGKRVGTVVYENGTAVFVAE